MLGDYALVFSKCHSITFAIVSITGVGRKFKECCPHFPNEQYLQMLAICLQDSLRIPKIDSLFATYCYFCIFTAFAGIFRHSRHIPVSISTSIL